MIRKKKKNTETPKHYSQHVWCYIVYHIVIFIFHNFSIQVITADHLCLVQTNPSIRPFACNQIHIQLKYCLQTMYNSIRPFNGIEIVTNYLFYTDTPIFFAYRLQCITLHHTLQLNFHNLLKIRILRYIWEIKWN